MNNKESGSFGGGLANNTNEDQESKNTFNIIQDIVDRNVFDQKMEAIATNLMKNPSNWKEKLEEE